MVVFIVSVVMLSQMLFHTNFIIMVMIIFFMNLHNNYEKVFHVIEINSEKVFPFRPFNYEMEVLFKIETLPFFIQKLFTLTFQ